VREETGLQVQPVGLCGIAERFLEGDHFVILDYWARVEGGDVVAGDDAADAAWVDRAALERLELVPGLTTFLAEHGVLDLLR
jgi:8-oxo-dGTP diphosphatase